MVIHSFLCLFFFLGASLHHPVLLYLPARGRASSLCSVTVRTLGNRAGTSGLTAGSWYVLAGTARSPPCVVVHLSLVILTPKAVSPNPRASVAWTTGSPSISPQLKPRRVTKVRATRSRRTTKGISLWEMDLIVGH